MRRNRSIRWEDGNIKESSEKPGVSREHPESHDDEEHADPLDALIAELERIEGQQVTIKDAVQHSKPIVVHPRKEALEDDEPSKPQTPQRFVASGGLAAYNVAQDLLSTEFSAPEEAPDEFRSMQYDSERITTLASGVSGTFGEISDPTSQALHDFLRRLQDQANQVRELIANQQTITRSAAVLRKSGGSEQRGGIRAAQGGLQSFEVPVPSPPRVSEGAVSIESKPSKGKAHHLEIVASGLDADATITLTTGGLEQASAHVRQTKEISMAFYNRNPQAHMMRAPSRVDLLGLLCWLLYVAAFIFYLFTRGTTVSAAGRMPLFLYQLSVLVAECLLFISGALIGVWQVRHSGVPLDNQTSVDGAANTTAALERPSVQYHVHVLVLRTRTQTGRREQALKAASAMEMLNGHTLTVYLVGSARDLAKTESNSDPAFDGVVHISASDSCTNNASILNDALHKIFPSHAAIPPTAVVAVLEDDQVPDVAYLKDLLPHLGRGGVRMVHSPVGYKNIDQASDLYDQLETYWQMHMLPRAEAWGCSACGNTNFVILASTLHNIGWLPVHSSSYGLAMALRLKLANRLSHFHPELLAQGWAPVETASIFKRKHDEAFRKCQLLLRQAFIHLLHFGIMQKLIFNTVAWSQGVTAVTAPIFYTIPLIRIVFGVFPFGPNRFFGIGFLVYYCFSTLLLYKVYEPATLCAVWNWTVASQNLWWHYLLAIFAAICSKLYNAGALLRNSWRKDQTVLARERGDVRSEQDAHTHLAIADLENGQEADISVEPPKEFQQAAASASHARWKSFKAIPWANAVLFACSLAGAAVGIWSLFGAYGTRETAGCGKIMIDILAANLPLILSILWTLCNAVVHSIPLVYFVTCEKSAAMTYEDVQLKRGRRWLAGYSMSSLAVVVMCMILAAIACVWQGAGSFTLQGELQGRDTDYNGALEASMSFYAAQRSGSLGSPHISWRGDSGLNDVPLGGFYLGTNNLKLTFPTAAAALQIAWGVASLPSSASVDDQIYQHLRWAAQYLLACRLTPDSLVSQVGNMERELRAWTRPEDMQQSRPSFVISPQEPGADLMGQTAAALAAASVALSRMSTSDAASFSAQTLTAATELYVLAAANEGLYSTNFIPNQKLFNSTSYLDDLMLAASWLGMVTGRAAYVRDAESYWDRIFNDPNNTSWQGMVSNWDNAWWASNLLLWKQTGKLRYKTQLDSFFSSWMAGGNGVTLTPKGLALAGSQGQLGNAANAALLGLVYGRYSGGADGILRACWARRQVQRILGCSGQNYMAGWGDDPPTHIPNPAASCPASVQPCSGFLASSPQYSSPDPNPHVLTGALVSGPDATNSFNDTRSAADTTVSIDFNGGFSGALAMLASREWSQTCEGRPGLLDRAGADLHHNIW